MKTVSFLVALSSIICFSTATRAQHDYAVGYKAVVTNDLLRRECSSNNFLKVKSNSLCFRPLLVHIWYPAISDESLGKMSHRNYHFIIEEFLQQKEFTDEQKRIEEVLLLSRISADSSEVRAHFHKYSLAQKDAEPIRETSPLVIHSGHVKAQWEFNEALAKNGFIVLSVDALETPNQEMSVVNDISFGLSYINNKTPLKYDKVVGIGSGYGGSNIFCLQMTTLLLDGIISFDGVEHWIGKIDHFEKIMPLQFSIRRIGIPYFRFYSHDTRTADSLFNSTFKYSEKFLINTQKEGYNHGFFQYPHSINKYSATTKNKLADDLLEKKIHLTKWFNGYLRGSVNDHSALENFTDSSELEHISPYRMPPNSQEITLLLDSLGREGLEQLIKNHREIDKDFIDFTLLFDLGRNLTWNGKIKEGIPYLELANDLFPNEPSGYMELIKASFWLKEEHLNEQYIELAHKATRDGILNVSPRFDELISRYKL